MLEGVADLTLDQLNEVSQPWVELEYNRKVHSEIGQTPLQRFLNDKNVAQPCPSTEKLQLAFTTEVRRIQRRSDGTLTLEGIRFEVPSRFGHLPRTLAALRFLGLEHGLSGRSENRRHPLPHLSRGQKQKCRRPARAQNLRARFTTAAPASGHGAFAPKDHPAIRHHRIASSLSASTPKSTKPIMNKRLLNLYSLKFNPFSSQLPATALWATPADPKLLLAHRTPDRRRRLCPGRWASPASAKAPRCASSPST